MTESLADRVAAVLADHPAQPLTSNRIAAILDHPVRPVRAALNALLAAGRATVTGMGEAVGWAACTPPPANLDERIEEWHHRPDGGVPLHEHLGLTWTEWKTWGATGTLPGREGKSATMAAVQIVIDSPETHSRHLDVSRTGPLAIALRDCIGVVAEAHPDDPAVQRIAEAAYQAVKESL